MTQGGISLHELWEQYLIQKSKMYVGAAHQSALQIEAYATGLSRINDNGMSFTPGSANRSGVLTWTFKKGNEPEVVQRISFDNFNVTNVTRVAHQR